MVIHKNSFSLLQPYDLHYPSCNEILETLRDVSKYFFYVWGSQAIKTIVKKRTDYSSKKISEKERTERKDKSEFDMETVEVPVTDKADEIFYKNGITVNFCICNLFTYHQPDFLGIEQIRNLYIPLFVSRLS